MRIDKLLAHAGYGTRKNVKHLVKNKLVKVDGKIVKDPGLKVQPDKQIVFVSDEQVDYQQYIYIMLNKPQNVISATYDQVDKTVIDLVPLKYKHYSLAPVGRLDKDTEGFILLTNDGKLNHQLTSPKANIWKTYYARIKGNVRPSHQEQFTKGVLLDDGYKTKPAKLNILNSGSESIIELAITEGKFHQVKRMFQAIGMEVIYLKRIQIGEILLDNRLQLGESRLLKDEELTWVLSIKRGE